MRKLLVTCVLLLMGSRALFPLDLTTHRRIVINGFENRGDHGHDYVAEVLRAALFQQASGLPFITLSEKKRAILADKLSRDMPDQDEQDQIEGNGAPVPEGDPLEIPFRLQVSATMDDPVPEEFPLIISGRYWVTAGPEEPESLYLEVRALDTLTGEEETSNRTSVPLASFLDEPYPVVSSLFQELLPFRSIQVRLSAEPADALIYLDGGVVGAGSFRGLVQPGIHRVTVYREGYREYSDLVRMDRDFSRRIVLEPGGRLRSILVVTDVPGVSVYLDNRLAGTAPLELEAPPRSTVTLFREGYVTEMFPLSEVPAAETVLHVSLRTPEQVENAQLHAEQHRNRAKRYSFTGFGLLALAIFFGVEATLNRQRADLYEGTDPDRYDQALQAQRTYQALTVSSSLLTGGSFLLSFYHTVNYFRRHRDAEAADIR